MTLSLARTLIIMGSLLVATPLVIRAIHHDRDQQRIAEYVLHRGPFVPIQLLNNQPTFPELCAILVGAIMIVLAVALSRLKPTGSAERGESKRIASPQTP